METLFEKMGGTYTLGTDGLYYPDIQLPEDDEPCYGKYGRMRLEYLKAHRPTLHMTLLLEEKLNTHLNEIDHTANKRISRFVAQMQKQEGITEQLKAADPLAWVGAMNNFKNAAEEIVIQELIND